MVPHFIEGGGVIRLEALNPKYTERAKADGKMKTAYRWADHRLIDGLPKIGVAVRKVVRDGHL
jgi:hypothetical protein